MLGALVAIAGTGVASAAPGRGRQVSVTVHEGTNFAVAASPDRRRIVIDMQNALRRLPFGGGRARKLTNNLTPATQPDFSPDGRTIFFQGYVGNNFHIWSIHPDGTALRRLTSGPYDDRAPRVSPDGRQVAFSSDRGGSYDIWVLDLAGGGITRLTTTPSQESQPTWSPDGRMLAFVVDNTRIDARDASGAVRTMSAAPQGRASAHRPGRPTESASLMSGVLWVMLVDARAGRPVRRGRSPARWRMRRAGAATRAACCTCRGAGCGSSPPRPGARAACRCG
jgi:Tol biopolymer transport system component